MESSEDSASLLSWRPTYPKRSCGESSESKSESNIVVSPSSQTALLEAKLKAIKEQLALQRELDVVEQQKSEIVRKLSAYKS